MRLFSILLVALPAIFALAFYGLPWFIVAAIIATIFGFMMFIEDVIENPRKH